MKKILITAILIVTVLAGCNSPTKDYSFTIENLPNFDAKFFKDVVITSVESRPQIIDLNGNIIKTSQDVYTNWIDCIPEKSTLLYGNGSNEAGALVFDKDYNIIKNTVFFNDPLLKIDPSCALLGENYYFTFTYIEGAVNNPDPNAENGLYTVMLYKTRDFDTVEKIGPVISVKNNIEDVELVTFGNELRIIYEKETYDKGPSEICMKSFDESALTWSEEKVIISDGSDTEPGKVFTNPDGSFSLYVSSDINNPNESYRGGNIFRFDFDKDAEFISKSAIDGPIDKGILLYDIILEKDKAHYLFEKYHEEGTDLMLRTQTSR